MSRKTWKRIMKEDRVEKRKAMAADPRRGFVWKAADGRKLSLDQITDKHLGNILRYLDKKALAAGGKDGYDHSIFGDNWKILHEEANRRGFIWRVFPGKLYTPCTFPVGKEKARNFNGNEVEINVDCGADSIMYTANDEVGTTKIEDQEARCEKHRPDRHSFLKTSCYGCLKDTNELVIELGGQLYCQECITEPESSFWDMLGVFMALVTWLMACGRAGKAAAYGAPAKLPPLTTREAPATLGNPSRDGPKIPG